MCTISNNYNLKDIYRSTKKKGINVSCYQSGNENNQVATHTSTDMLSSGPNTAKVSLS